MNKLKILDLFSGIGGFEIASRLADPNRFETIAFCELNKAARNILKKRYPFIEVSIDRSPSRLDKFAAKFTDAILAQEKRIAEN